MDTQLWRMGTRLGTVAPAEAHVAPPRHVGILAHGHRDGRMDTGLGTLAPALAQALVPTSTPPTWRAKPAANAGFGSHIHTANPAGKIGRATAQHQHQPCRMQSKRERGPRSHIDTANPAGKTWRERWTWVHTANPAGKIGRETAQHQHQPFR